MAEDDRAVAEGLASWNLQGGMGSKHLIIAASFRLGGKGGALAPTKFTLKSNRISHIREVLHSSFCSRKASYIQTTRTEGFNPFKIIRSQITPDLASCVHRSQC